jgi:methyltransferase
VIIQRVGELVLARRNERWLRAQGAVEVGADHYPAIVALHTLWLAGMIAEIIFLSRQLSPFYLPLLLIFLAAQGLRYWTIRTLGRRWTTRILVLPGAPLVASGPFRYLRHPNYLAVAIEILTLPMIFGALVTGVTASIVNAVLLRIRIRAEEKGLGVSKRV